MNMQHKFQHFFVHEPGCASVHQQKGRHSRCMQILVRTVHTVQQTVFWLGFLVPVVVQRQVPWWGAQKTVDSRSCRFSGLRNAWFDCGYLFFIIQGGFWKNFYDFPRDWVDSDPGVNSRRSLHTWPMRKWSRSSSIMAVACVYWFSL